MLNGINSSVFTPAVRYAENAAAPARGGATGASGTSTVGPAVCYAENAGAPAGDNPCCCCSMGTKIKDTFFGIINTIGDFFVSIGYWFMENICCCCCAQSDKRAEQLLRQMDDVLKKKAYNDPAAFDKAFLSAYNKLSSSHKQLLQKELAGPQADEKAIVDAAARFLKPLDNADGIATAVEKYRETLQKAIATK